MRYSPESLALKICALITADKTYLMGDIIVIPHEYSLYNVCIYNTCKNIEDGDKNKTEIAKFIIKCKQSIVFNTNE